MKFTLVATVLLTFSLSAFAVEYPVLTTASPDQVGFDSQKLHRLDGWIQNQIDAGYPSINLLVIKDNHIVLQKAWGYAKKYDGSTLLAHPIRATTKEGANKQVISSQADSLIKISRIWADF
ncbi:hypothetical protein AIZ14_24860, partial [Salmonella enterica subsp. enterica serovar Typhimurium]